MEQVKQIVKSRGLSLTLCSPLKPLDLTVPLFDSHPPPLPLPHPYPSPSFEPRRLCYLVLNFLFPYLNQITLADEVSFPLIKQVKFLKRVLVFVTVLFALLHLIEGENIFLQWKAAKL